MCVCARMCACAHACVHVWSNMLADASFERYSFCCQFQISLSVWFCWTLYTLHWYFPFGCCRLWPLVRHLYTLLLILLLFEFFFFSFLVHKKLYCEYDFTLLFDIVVSLCPLVLGWSFSSRLINVADIVLNVLPAMCRSSVSSLVRILGKGDDSDQVWFRFCRKLIYVYVLQCLVLGFFVLFFFYLRFLKHFLFYCIFRKAWFVISQQDLVRK